MIKKYSVCLGAICLMGSLAMLNRLEAQIVISDDFNDNQINSSIWSVYSEGSGPALQEVNQRVEMTIPSTTSGANFGVSLQMMTSLPGDFDARIDYSLLNWPFQSEIRIGIGLTVPWVAMERVGFASGERYVAQFYDGTFPVSTTDSQGKLRIARTSSVYSGYYWNDIASNWILLDTGTGPSGPVNVAFTVWGYEASFPDQLTTVAFDNFELTAVPEPQHYLLFSSCLLAGLALARKRLHKIP